MRMTNNDKRQRIRNDCVRAPPIERHPVPPRVNSSGLLVPRREEQTTYLPTYPAKRGSSHDGRAGQCAAACSGVVAPSFDFLNVDRQTRHSQPTLAIEPMMASTTRKTDPPRAMPPTIPAKPKMGSVIQVGSEFVAVVGGKPKADWSGLQQEEEPASSAVSPMRHRTASTGIGYLQRTTGLVPAFAVRAGSDFGAFAEKVQRHLDRTGMDTIAYVPDPSDPRRVVSCVTDHARFDPSVMREVLQGRFKMYDSYDRWNDDDAVRYLLASVSKKLRDRVRANAHGEPFAQHFAELVAAVRDAAPPSNRAKAAPRAKAAKAATTRADELMARIGAVKPPERSWQCIEEARNAVLPVVDELVASRAYKHALTRTLAWNLVAADRTDAHASSYKSAICAFISAHEEGLRAIRVMTKRDKDQYMANRHLMPKDLFEVASRSCHEPNSAALWSLANPDNASRFQFVPLSATAPFAPNADADNHASSDVLLQGMLSQYSDAND
jgi:hypothetical protein